MAAPYNAACNGSANDTAAFTSAISAGTLIVVPPPDPAASPATGTCLVKELSLGSGKTLDCNGATPQLQGPANWVIKKTGVRSIIRNCIIKDPNHYTKDATTLSVAAAPGQRS